MHERDEEEIIRQMGDFAKFCEGLQGSGLQEMPKKEQPHFPPGETVYGL